MVLRMHHTFGALIAVQAMHSVEECRGRLWESYPPAHWVASLVSSDPARGFVIGNVVLVAFGMWCFFWPIRQGWATAMSLAWFWVVIEFINGLAHPLWSIAQGGYTPGVATAPALLILSICLAVQLRRRPGA